MSRVIICGLGDVGYRVATLLLDLGEAITIVTLESRSEWLAAVKKRGAEVVIGDARDEELLEQSGLETATAVIACTHHDATNVEISLDVKRLHPRKRTVARIVDPSLARHAEKHLGVHRAVAMTTAAAPALAAATFGDSVLSEVEVGGERYMALRVEGPQHLGDPALAVISATGECLSGQSADLKEGELAVVLMHSDSLSERRPKHRSRDTLAHALSPVAVGRFVHAVWTNISVQLRAVLIVILSVIVISIAVFHFAMKLSVVDSLYFVVTTATTTGYGDLSPKDSSDWLKLYTCFMMIISATGLAILFSVVTDYILTARIMKLGGRHHVPDHGQIIVVGAGTVGYRTIEELVRLKTPVVAIDSAEHGEHHAAIRAKSHLITGDGREPETLIRAGVKHAKAIIALTPSDSINMAIGLTAKELNPNLRVVISILNADFARKAGSIPDIDAALNLPMLAAPTFVGAALYETAVASFRLGSIFFTLIRDEKGTVKVGGHSMTLEARSLPA